MIDKGGTAIPTQYFRNLGNGVFITEAICRCYTTEPNTTGTIYCPLHGEMRKLNGVVEVIKPLQLT